MTALLRSSMVSGFHVVAGAAKYEPTARKKHPGRSPMKIYWIKAQAPKRVLALVKHLKINAELIEVDAKAGGLRSPEYAALNPNKKAPVLVDGDYVLWEASAIMAYLCIKAGSDMWP